MSHRVLQSIPLLHSSLSIEEQESAACNKFCTMPYHEKFGNEQPTNNLSITVPREWFQFARLLFSYEWIEDAVVMASLSWYIDYCKNCFTIHN